MEYTPQINFLALLVVIFAGFEDNFLEGQPQFLSFVWTVSVFIYFVCFILFVQVLLTNHSWERRWQNSGWGICQKLVAIIDK